MKILDKITHYPKQTIHHLRMLINASVTPLNTFTKYFIWMGPTINLI